ncbi:MAG: hypothetical protein ACRDWI_19580 [Jiangellaceae bacterium]
MLVDTWRHFRGAADEDMLLAIPAERIRSANHQDDRLEAEVDRPVRWVLDQGASGVDRDLRHDDA